MSMQALTVAGLLAALVTVSLARDTTECGGGPIGSDTTRGATADPQPASPDPAAPAHLRCEYLIDPLGIDRAAPRLFWEMVDSRRGARQSAYQVLVADDPAALRAERGNLWDSGKVASDQSIHVAYAGQPLTSGLRAYWQVRIWDQDGRPSPWSAPATWTMGLLAPGDWQAHWIGDPTPPPPPHRSTDAPPEPLPGVLLRKEFGLEQQVRRATAYITALGVYELRINGRRVGDHLLAPEWTDYTRRVNYQTYDVTELVQPGNNALGVLLGDGWYAGTLGLGGEQRGHYGRQPRLLLRLDIEEANGKRRTVVTDGSWRSTLEGPIRRSDLLDGEFYDAQRELPGWDRPGFDDSHWTPAAACGPAGGAVAGFSGPAVRHNIGAAGTAPAGEPPPAAPVLQAQRNEPIRVVRELPPVRLSEPAPGTYIYDLGQNFAGWCRLKLRAPAGTTVTLRHAEVLYPDGTLYTANLRGAQATDTYLCRGPASPGAQFAAGQSAAGTDSEIFEPHFTYHGFRYVEVTGLPYRPAAEDLTGIAFCSGAPPAGTFECSEPLLNRLVENILWTQRANMMSVPTDCPQRDERLGWTGDILAFAQAACFNLDMAAFLGKWLPDLRDAQADDGRYPDFAPHPFGRNARFSGVPAWGDAGVFVPWRAYVNYGDRELLAAHFDSACRWIDWIAAQNPDRLWKNARHNDYGDWLNADTLKLEGWPKGAEVPKEVFATMFFARSAELVAGMAAVLDRADEARRYGQLAEEIRAAFNRAYVAPDSRMPGHTQAGYALALHFDLLPPELRPAAVRYMLEGFDTYRGNISTGFHSTICLMRELNRAGLTDRAYALLMNRTMPSWLYPLEHGATTIWERWDGYVEGRGFQDPGMNSFSHYAFGCVGEWMYRTILGINPDEPAGAPGAAHCRPGYKHFVLRPQPGGGLTWARGEYHSIHGRIASSWKLTAGKLTLDFTIPANTSATVYIPAADPAAVRESGRPAAESTGVRFLSAGDGTAVYHVQSGSYSFEVPAGAAR